MHAGPARRFAFNTVANERLKAARIDYGNESLVFGAPQTRCAGQQDKSGAAIRMKFLATELREGKG